MTPVSNSFTSQSDIGGLWAEAITRYNATPGLKIQIPLHPWTSQSMAEFQDEQLKKFEKWRGSQDSKIVPAIGASIAPVFAPAPIITHALFFDVVEAFFLRLELLENRIPEGLSFAEKLVQVFGKILKLCAIAQAAANKGKFKGFLKELANSGHSDVSGPYAEVQTAMNRLDSAALMAILGTSVESNHVLKRVETSLHQMDSTVSAGLSKLDTQVTFMSSGFEKVEREVRSLRRAVQQDKMDDPFSTNKKGDTRTTDAGSRISNSLEHMRSLLEISDSEAWVKQTYAQFKHEYIEDTCKWITKDNVFEDWLSEDESQENVVILTGGQNTGKSMISLFIFDYLQRRIHSRPAMFASVAYFRFSDTNEEAMRILQDSRKERHSNASKCWRSILEYYKPLDGAAVDDSSPFLFLVLDGVDTLKSKEESPYGNQDESQDEGMVKREDKNKCESEDDDSRVKKGDTSKDKGDNEEENESNDKSVLKLQFINCLKRIRHGKYRIKVVLTANTAEKIFPSTVPPTPTIRMEGNINADIRTFAKFLARTSTRLSWLSPKKMDELVDSVCGNANRLVIPEDSDKTDIPELTDDFNENPVEQINAVAGYLLGARPWTAKASHSIALVIRYQALDASIKEAKVGLKSLKDTPEEVTIQFHLCAWIGQSYCRKADELLTPDLYRSSDKPLVKDGDIKDFQDFL
ncbi:hypothetical protein B0T17DRAFT_657473 [Bombardia bombarda]|uniref:Nephrocystin 3-like N-terminal domain-containing protein n=1 Tax=Bombardia bombarda TaxID=252184 RepID=A0AA39WH64_9PEZI|nr:hypothetical protein B0T17DRAFT_657473 [Bombardia bombarda]